MTDRIINLIFMFFFFSAIGWTVECTYRSLGERRIINSGFLHGPMCPIYGTGALVFEVLLVPLSEPSEKRWWMIILLGVVAADIVEYITSYLMEKLFHARWWDYSNNFLNINGRICFKHSCYWAVFAFVYPYVVSPLYHIAEGFLTQKMRTTAVIVIFVIFLLDLALTVKAAVNIQKINKQIDAVKQMVYIGTEAIRTSAEEVKDTASGKVDEFRETIAVNSEKYREWRDDVSRQFGELKDTIQTIRSDKKQSREAAGTKRLFRSYGSLRENVSDAMKQIENRINELKEKTDKQDKE